MHLIDLPPLLVDASLIAMMQHGLDEDVIMPEEDIMDNETFGETFTTMTAQMEEYVPLPPLPPQRSS